MSGFDTTIHIGDVLITILGLVLTWLGWGLRKAFQAVKQFVDTVNNHSDRLLKVEKVVDTHTEVLAKAGWMKGRELIRLHLNGGNRG